MDNGKKMGIGTIVNTTGAILAYEIGAGFASGQETMQFFSSWGSFSAVFIMGGIFIVGLTLILFGVGYIGRTREAGDVNALYQVIGGKYFSKLLSFFVWGYNLGCYFFMISGFGNVLNQQFGMDIAFGSGLAVVISVFTALLGLKKMVDIIGKIGPIIVGFSIILGIISAFWTYPHIPEGCELIQSGAIEVPHAGHSVLLSALAYTGTCTLLPMAYFAHIGYDFKEYRYKDTKMIFLLAALSYGICLILLALNFIGDIAECGPVAIPNLILANRFLPAAGLIFSVIILLAIYSTMCPILWTCASMLWKDETSLPYRSFIVVCGIVVYVVTLFVPYQTLLNYIMTYFGYTGAISGVAILVRYYMLKREDKKAAMNVHLNGEVSK